MKKTILWITALALLLCASCGPGGASDSGGGYGMTVPDADGNDISAEVTELWRKANDVYNVDETETFEMTGEPILLLDNAPAFYELLDYDSVTDEIFTPDGKARLEEAVIGGHTLIQKRDGVVYRMGPWKTGISFGNALVGMKALSVSDAEILLSMDYSVKMFEDSRVEGQADFKIVRINGVWLVDDYIYPEAGATL